MRSRFWLGTTPLHCSTSPDPPVCRVAYANVDVDSAASASDRHLVSDPAGSAGDTKVEGGCSTADG